MGGTGLSGVLIGNESGLTCKVTLQGANVSRTLYPGTVDFFEVPSNKTWNGNLQIDPTADLNNVSFWPGSYVFVDTFGIGERPSGIFPMALNRAGNIGNQVTTTVGSATSVQNDNNAAGTVFVEATVLGSPSSNVSMAVDGSGWFGRWVNPTFTKVFQWFSSGTTALILGAAGLLTHILGSLTVDQNLAVTGTATFNGASASIDGSSNFNGNAVNTNNVNTGVVAATTVNCTTANASTLHSTGAGNIDGNLTVGGTSSLDNTKITSNGAGTLTVVKEAFTTGSIKRIARFTGSSDQTITHNWGEQADIVLAYYNGAFGSAPTQAIAIKNEGANSFEVVGQTGYSWTVCAIKF